MEGVEVSMSRDVEKGGAEGCGHEERSRLEAKQRRAPGLRERWVITAITKQVITQAPGRFRR